MNSVDGKPWHDFRILFAVKSLATSTASLLREQGIQDQDLRNTMKSVSEATKPKGQWLRDGPATCPKCFTNLFQVHRPQLLVTLKGIKVKKINE